MKKLLLCAICFILLFANAAMADSAQPGAYAGTWRDRALDGGLELYTVTTLEWGGLPLLSDADNAMLSSLLGVLRLEERTQGAGGNGYLAHQLFLQNVSVLDMALQAEGGVYYEQSNLLGGQTVAFTQEAFAGFTRRLAARTGGVMPGNLAALYEIVMLALGGMDTATVDTETLDSAMAILSQWETEALTSETRRRPPVNIPGLYGATAEVIGVSRGEALALVTDFAQMLSGEEAMWEQNVRGQMAGAEETEVAGVLARIAEMLATLPEDLEDALPMDMPPAEYRIVYGLDGVEVCRQIEVELPGTGSLLVEWARAEQAVPALFVLGAMEDAAVSLLYTREVGTPSMTGTVMRARNRAVAEFRLTMAGLDLSVMMTRAENIELRAEKEIITAKTDWMIECPQWLGEETVVTVTRQETDTATGTGEDFAQKHQTNWFLKGLGFDRQKILTVTENTKVEGARQPIDIYGPVVYPARMDEEAFDAWLAGVQVSLVQAGYTVIGRLPPDVAAYLLEQTR